MESDGNFSIGGWLSRLNFLNCGCIIVDTVFTNKIDSLMWKHVIGYKDALGNISMHNLRPLFHNAKSKQG